MVTSYQDFKALAHKRNEWKSLHRQAVLPTRSLLKKNIQRTWSKFYCKVSTTAKLKLEKKKYQTVTFLLILLKEITYLIYSINLIPSLGSSCSGIITMEGSHPQKQTLRFVCKAIYFIGIGDYWYENERKSTIHKRVYNTIAIIANVFLVGGIFNVWLAYLRADLSSIEKNQISQSCYGYLSIYLKVIAIYFQKKRIAYVMKRLLDDNRAILTSIKIEKSSVKSAVFNSSFFFVAVYLTLVTSLLESVRVFIKTGRPFGTVVTLFPTPAHSGFIVNVFRSLVEIHYWYLVGVMCFIESLTICCLKFLTCRFELVQLYFKNMRQKVIENSKHKNPDVIVKEFKGNLITGIKLHEDALWCANNIQLALGNSYSILVLQGVILVVICLIKLVTNKDLSFLLANLLYIMAVIFITGAYMTSGGDITYEAGNISTAIYHSGWELLKADRETRVLAVVAIIRSQKPIYMKAFGKIPLSYSNFISVMRMAYSFFAVIY